MKKLNLERIIGERTGNYPFMVLPIYFNDWYLSLQQEVDDNKNKKDLLWNRVSENFTKVKSMLENYEEGADTKDHVQGISESSFASCINTYVNFEAFTKKRIRYNETDYCVADTFGFEPKHDSRNYFYPDILLHDQNSGLWFDIEIDEPYSMKSGTPIHFVSTDEDDENSNYTYREEYRNAVLATKGIIVVRFAEEQVVRYPHDCIYFLNSIVSSIVKYDGFHPIAFDSCFSGWNEQYSIRRWNETEAIKMAEDGYRNTYLTSDKTIWKPKNNGSISPEQLAEMIQKTLSSIGLPTLKNSP